VQESAAKIVQRARLKAGLSQRALATKAATAQSVVARVELGLASPSWDTLARLLGAAGFQLEVRLTPSENAPVTAAGDIPRVQALDPAARLQEMRNADRFFSAIRRAS
jgi:transcriptional regulator with XRE-family HTH domain